jgi:hypothetical protein
MKSSNNKNKINNNKKKLNIKSSNQVNLFSNKNSSKNFSEKDFSNSSSFSEEEISKSSFLSPSEEKEFKKMEISKNKDKLKKNHGCQDLITNLNEIKNLVDHTNRIFLYKTKMNSTSKKPKKFNTIIEDRFLNNDLNYDEENKISEKDKIISKIDKLISQIDVSK